MRRIVFVVAALVFATATLAAAAGPNWDPQVFAKADTIQLRTTGPKEGEYWFPVWVVVLDGQVYVRLGTRATERIQKNTTAPFIGVKVGNEEFPKVKAEAAPEQANRVADAMAKKYWSDLLVRFLSHPLTMRLIPVPQ